MLLRNYQMLPMYTAILLTFAMNIIRWTGSFGIQCLVILSAVSSRDQILQEGDIKFPHKNVLQIINEHVQNLIWPEGCFGISVCLKWVLFTQIKGNENYCKIFCEIIKTYFCPKWLYSGNFVTCMFSMYWYIKWTYFVGLDSK